MRQLQRPSQTGDGLFPASIPAQAGRSCATRAVSNVRGGDALRPRAMGWSMRRVPDHVRRGYLLLETVVATGLLIVALAVIGGQVQKSDHAIKEMALQVRANTLAEQFLGEMDLGLVELDSLNNIERGDFGPRFPDWGWRMVTERTAIKNLFLLRIEILYLPRQDTYRQNTFEYDAAKTIETVYASRAKPERVDFALDFGLDEDAVNELSNRMADAGLPDFDPTSFNIRDYFGNTPSEDLMQQLPLLMDSLGFELKDVAAFVPPDLLEELKGMGLFGQPEAQDEADRGKK